MDSEVAYRGLAWLIWLYRVPCFLLCLTATSPLSFSDIHVCPARSYCIITPPPDIIQSCCVIINLSVPRVSQKSCGESHRGPQRQVYHNARGCLLRLLKAVLGALQSAHPSQQASTKHLSATHTRDRKQVRSTRGVKCYITTANGKKRKRKKDSTYRRSEISRFKVRVPLHSLLFTLSSCLYQVPVPIGLPLPGNVPPPFPPSRQLIPG